MSPPEPVEKSVMMKGSGWIDGGSGAIGVVDELGANKEFAVLSSGEDDGVAAGASGDGCGEGSSDGDGVAAVPAIDGDRGVAAVGSGVVVSDGDDVVAEATDGCGCCAAVREM